jgi:hypothetical protein
MAKKKSQSNYYLAKGRRLLRVVFKNVIKAKQRLRSGNIERPNFVSDFKKLGLMRQIKHEEKFGLYNSDYGSVKINWDLFTEINEIKKTASAENYKLKEHSIQSTYFPNRQSRITW